MLLLVVLAIFIVLIVFSMPIVFALGVAGVAGLFLGGYDMQVVDALLDRPLPVPDLGDSGQEEREFGVVSHNGAQPQHAKSGMRVADGSDEASHG